MIRLRKKLALLFLALVTSSGLYALEEHEKLWVGLYHEANFDLYPQWSYLLFTQTRLINESHPWTTTYFEGGIGYSHWQDVRLWAGYRFAGNEPNNGFFISNRLWQQVSWKIKHNEDYRFTSRTRVEESEYGNQSQISLQLRQRLMLEYFKQYFGSLNPKTWDEIFFQLNRTDYTSHRRVNQNRLFLGFDWYTGKGTFWEIGYINQYELSTPLNYQNQMNHIASITYNIA